MPKLVDWAARYDFIREAVVRLAADHGAAAVTMASVAAELNVSTATLRRAVDSPASLPGLGARWIAKQRRYRRYLRRLPPGVERGSVEHAVWLLRHELPDRDEQVEHERAWAQLVHRGASESILVLQQDDDLFVDGLIDYVLAQLGTDETSRSAQAVLVRAMLDGLKIALCRERTTLEVALGCLEACLAQVRSSAISPDAA